MDPAEGSDLIQQAVVARGAVRRLRSQVLMGIVAECPQPVCKS